MRGFFLEVEDHANFNKFCSDLRQHQSLKHVYMNNAIIETADTMRGFVDAAVALKLEKIVLYDCWLTPAVVPELTRLVAAGWVEEILIENKNASIFRSNASTDHFCAVARVSSLKKLRILEVGSSPKVCWTLLSLPTRKTN